jgi:hypothetical protein
MSISSFKLNVNVNAPHYDPEDWIDEDILSDIDDEIEKDPEFQAWLTSADTEDEEEPGSSSVWVPLSRRDLERANQFAQAHPNPSFAESIRQKTLAGAALTHYLESHGISVDRGAASHSSGILQLLNPTADAVLPKLGKLEALPISTNAGAVDFSQIRVDVDLNPATLAYVILSLERSGAELHGVLLASDLLQDFPEGGAVFLALMKPLAALWEAYQIWQRQERFMAGRNEARDWSLTDRGETIRFLNHLLVNVPDYERPDKLSKFLRAIANPNSEQEERNLQAVREQGPAPIEADSGDWLDLAMDWLDELELGNL